MHQILWPPSRSSTRLAEASLGVQVRFLTEKGKTSNESATHCSQQSGGKVRVQPMKWHGRRPSLIFGCPLDQTQQIAMFPSAHYPDFTTMPTITLQATLALADGSNRVRFCRTEEPRSTFGGHSRQSITVNAVVGIVGCIRRLFRNKREITKTWLGCDGHHHTWFHLCQHVNQSPLRESITHPYGRVMLEIEGVYYSIFTKAAMY